jgi:hypothetical protein
VATAFSEFLELLFQLCLTLCTETFVDGQPDSALLVYFSGILGFSFSTSRHSPYCKTNHIFYEHATNACTYQMSYETLKFTF